MSEDSGADRVKSHDRPARASDRLRGLAKHAYEPDPDTYLRGLRTEIEDHLVTREAARRVPGDSDEPELRASSE